MDLRKKENRYETNPFVLKLKDKMFLQPKANTIIAKGQNIIDTNTGEIINESVLIGRRKIVDKSQFAKIYASEIGLLYELSKPAQNVFLYLTKIMDYDNRAYINAENDCNKLNYKTPLSVIKGIKELLKNEIIACDVRPYHYWLNPTIVCKGERFAKYTEYILDKTGETDLRAQSSNLFKELPDEILHKIDKANKPLQTNIFGGLDPVE